MEWNISPTHMTAWGERPGVTMSDVMLSAGDPPWKWHKWSVCSHPDTAPRLKSYETTGPRAILQCLECGKCVGSFIPRHGVDEPWDCELAEITKRDYDAAIKKWEQDRASAITSAQTAVEAAKRATYNEYLKTDIWKDKRRRVLERCGGVCESCLINPAEHVHHKQYSYYYGHEPLFDLVGVCVPCHELLHPHMRGG